MRPATTRRRDGCFRTRQTKLQRPCSLAALDASGPQRYVVPIVGSGDAATLVGKVLDARFRVTGLIGIGSMGAVYRAHDTTQGGEVAVKVLHPPFAVDDRAVARFRREARAASQLDHPGCVEILGFGVDGAHPYIAMELLEGETLYQLLERVGSLSAAQAVQIGIQVCSALEVAHERGIVHRDLKPENIMVLRPGQSGPLRVKLLDFGIAKLVTPMTADSFSWDTASDRLTKPGTALGSPAFMAPEQVRGDAIDDRTDIYVVGILLYEMVTGCVPFGGDDPVQVLTSQLREPPPLPSSLRPHLHPELERAILTCLEKSRAARWPTARVLRQFLEHLLTELGGAPAAAEITREQVDDGEEEEYGLTEPVNVQWARERFAALRDLGIDKNGEDTSTFDTRETGETRVEGRGQVKRSPRPEQDRGTGETRVVSGLGGAGSSAVVRETSETRIVRPGSLDDGSTGVGSAVEPQSSSPEEGDDIPTIEVYDDDSVDIEMQIETVVKEREPIPGLQEAIARAKLKTAQQSVKRGGSAVVAERESVEASSDEDDEFDDLETLERRKDDLPDHVREILASSSRAEAAAGVPRSLTEEDLDSVTNPHGSADLSRRIAEQLDDSAMSISSIDLEIVSEEEPAAGPDPAPQLTPLVEDDSLDRLPVGAAAVASGAAEEAFDAEATVARPPRQPASEPVVRSPSSPAFQDDDEDGALATAVKPLSDEDIDAAVQTTVRPSSDDEQIDAALATAVTRQTDVSADAAVPTAVTRKHAVPVDDELATVVRTPEQAARDIELAARARAQQASGGPDWEEDNKPTTMMDRSQLSDGLSEPMRQALEAELGLTIEPTVDEPAPDLPSMGLGSSGPDARQGARNRTVPMTAPLPAIEAPPPRGAGTPRIDDAGPSVIPPAFAPSGGDDLDEMLRRMPRTRYPVFSTLLAIGIMIAAVAGLLWLIL